MRSSLPKIIPFEDKQQTFWQLAVIQSAALGLPVILVGGEMARQSGPGVAIGSILIGNLLLWVVGLTTIGMTDTGANAIQNVGNYLGKFGKLFFALIIGLAFLAWYTWQSKVSAVVISSFFSSEIRQELRIGAVLGVLTALLSMGGIKFIKWFNLFSFIAMLTFFISLLYMNYKYINNIHIGFALSGILATVAVTLPGIVNLPTFFRHAKSKPHAFLALSLMTIIVALFQCLGILIGTYDVQQFLGLQINGVFILAFALISLFSINLVNIYLAAGVLEAVFQRGSDAKDYAILGLVGTGSFALLQAQPIMVFLENISTAFIASLGAVLIGVFLIKIVVLHRPRFFEKLISNVCWFVGCLVSLIILIQNPNDPNTALLYGFGASALSFLSVVFIEETTWSIKEIVKKIRKFRLP